MSFCRQWRPTPVCVLLGPTGVGKTGLLEEIFYPGFEVISLIRTGLPHCSVGTAKPSADSAQGSLTSHRHTNPDEQFSPAIRSPCDIAPANHFPRQCPVVCGGTRLYQEFSVRLPVHPWPIRWSVANWKMSAIARNGGDAQSARLD